MNVSIIKLGLAALLPVLAAMGLYLLEKKTPYGSLNEKLRSVITGVIFGAFTGANTGAFTGANTGAHIGGPAIFNTDACTGADIGGPAISRFWRRRYSPILL